MMIDNLVPMSKQECDDSVPMSKQECIDALTEIGISIYYEPRVFLPDYRDGELVEMSVFEAVNKLRIWRKTN